jgi:hypothetical protein
VTSWSPADQQGLLGQLPGLVEPALQLGQAGLDHLQPPKQQRFLQVLNHGGELGQFPVQLEAPAQLPERIQLPGMPPRQVLVPPAVDSELGGPLTDA